MWTQRRRALRHATTNIARFSAPEAGEIGSSRAQCIPRATLAQHRCLTCEETPHKRAAVRCFSHRGLQPAQQAQLREPRGIPDEPRNFWKNQRDRTDQWCSDRRRLGRSPYRADRTALRVLIAQRKLSSNMRSPSRRSATLTNAHRPSRETVRRPGPRGK